MIKQAKNYYKIMKVSYDVSQEELKQTYYRLAKLYHPDINPKTGELFKEITVAYQTLSDPVKRKEYNLQEGIKVNNTCKKSKKTNKNTSQQLNEIYDELKDNDITNAELYDIIIKQLNIVNDLFKQFTETLTDEDEVITTDNKETIYENTQDFSYDLDDNIQDTDISTYQNTNSNNILIQFIVYIFHTFKWAIIAITTMWFLSII